MIVSRLHAMYLAQKHKKSLLINLFVRSISRASLSLFFLLFSLSLSAQLAFTEDMLDYPMDNKEAFDKIFEYEKVEKYLGECRENQVFLFNGFNQFYIDNPDIWKHLRKTNKAVSIDIVYSAYPGNFRRWQTEFCTLLTRRLKALFTLDPKLNDAHIRWKLIEQTDCSNSEEARMLLHGIIISYQDKVIESEIPDSDFVQIPISDQQDAIITSSVIDNTEQIAYQLESFGRISDSVVLKVLDRNPDWENMLLVVDWTSSMYPYGSQVVLWQALHMATSGIRHLEFFNDGNHTLNVKKIGKTGGIYFSNPNNLESIIKTMHWVREQGDGGDIPENDIEAILKGLQAFPDVEQVVLIADNNSEIRDFELADLIDKPVRIILCGDYLGINPQYLSLALKTGGSIHTIDRDISNLIQQFDNKQFEFNGFAYTIQPDSLVQIWQSHQSITSVEP